MKKTASVFLTQSMMGTLQAEANDGLNKTMTHLNSFLVTQPQPSGKS